jgi:hypothetical protein
MESIQSLIKKKTKRSKDTSESRIPVIHNKLCLDVNLASYLSEFLNLKELIEYAYTNKSNLRVKNKYIEKIERINLNTITTDEKEKLLLKLFLKNRSKFKNLKFLSISHYELNKDILNFPFYNLQELIIDFCHFDFSYYLKDEFFQKIFSSENLEKLVIKETDIFFYYEILDIFFYHLKNRVGFKHLIINDSIKCDEFLLKKIRIDRLFSIKDLETLDLSNNKIGFLGNQILRNFQKLENLKVLRLKNCDIKLNKEDLVFNPNNSCHSLELLDISKNYNFYFDIFSNSILKNKLNIQKCNIICDNLKKQRRRIHEFDDELRMLFSRSGVFYTNSLKKEEGNEPKILGKFMGRKPNGAILPQIIYDSPSNVEFTKEQLIEILRIENKIRLSEKAKDLYDKNSEKEISIHLTLDREMIKNALKIFGTNPDEDDSLKAYHLATTKFIHDEEVRNSVVWMKYDKCKVGNYTLGDHLNFDDIKLFDLDKKDYLLKDLISMDRPNLIVSGSMS